MKNLREISDKLKNYIAPKEGVIAQYTVSETETREITLENGEFSLFRTLFDNDVTVKVIHNQKIGNISANKFTDEVLKNTVDAAILSAESGAEDAFYDIAPGMDAAVFHKGVQEPEIDKLIERARELADDIKEKHPKVLLRQVMVKYVKEHSFYRNTNGSEDETFSGYYLVTTEFAGNDGADSTGISGSFLVTDCLEQPFIEQGDMEQTLCDAENSLHPVTLDGKFNGTVIFTPGAMNQMLMFGLNAFAGDSYILSGEAKWLGKIGEKVASEKLTIAIKPWDERIFGTAVRTEDGFRTEDYLLIENGILRSYLDSFYVSKKCNVPRALSTDLDMVVSTGDTKLAEMIKSIDKGLIIGAISCGYPGANGEISGVAKQSFYVENGEVKGAVNETMVSFNLADMFLNIEDVSEETICNGMVVMPYIKVGNILVSGK